MLRELAVVEGVAEDLGEIAQHLEGVRHRVRLGVGRRLDGDRGHGRRRLDGDRAAAEALQDRGQRCDIDRVKQGDVRPGGEHPLLLVGGGAHGQDDDDRQVGAERAAGGDFREDLGIEFLRQEKTGLKNTGREDHARVRQACPLGHLEVGGRR